MQELIIDADAAEAILADTHGLMARALEDARKERRRIDRLAWGRQHPTARAERMKAGALQAQTCLRHWPHAVGLLPVTGAAARRSVSVGRLPKQPTVPNVAVTLTDGLVSIRGSMGEAELRRHPPLDGDAWRRLVDAFARHSVLTA